MRWKHAAGAASLHCGELKIRVKTRPDAGREAAIGGITAICWRLEGISAFSASAAKFFAGAAKHSALRSGCGRTALSVFSWRQRIHAAELSSASGGVAAGVFHRSIRNDLSTASERLAAEN
jgi:hypothetical protein